MSCPAKRPHILALLVTVLFFNPRPFRATYLQFRNPAAGEAIDLSLLQPPLPILWVRIMFPSRIGHFSRPVAHVTDIDRFACYCIANPGVG
jgi:hypothetical protein